MKYENIKNKIEKTLIFFFFFFALLTIKKNSAFIVAGEFASPQLVTTGSFRTP